LSFIARRFIVGRRAWRDGYAWAATRTATNRRMVELPFAVATWAGQAPPPDDLSSGGAHGATATHGAATGLTIGRRMVDLSVAIATWAGQEPPPDDLSSGGAHGAMPAHGATNRPTICRRAVVVACSRLVPEPLPDT
jgi:hypothetical protein